MSQKSLADRAHDWLHALPGVPHHGAAARLNHRGGLHGKHPARANHAFHNTNARHSARPRHNPVVWHGREPRVLIDCQRAIAGLLARVGGHR
jgi:hypothetical protein